MLIQIFIVFFSIHFVSFFLDHTSRASEFNWAIRAREHFETHTYMLNGSKYEFRGLSNTLNIWKEVPYRYGIGLAISPIIGGAKVKDMLTPELGSDVNLWTVGIEGKYFPLSENLRAFLRLGLSWHTLKTKGTYGDLGGWGYYGGMGWEFPVGIISLAPEIAVRQVSLDRGLTGTILTPSIGVHFYPELRK